MTASPDKRGEDRCNASDFASGIRALMKLDDGPSIIGHGWSRERWLQLAELLDSFVVVSEVSPIEQAARICDQHAAMQVYNPDEKRVAMSCAERIRKLPSSASTPSHVAESVECPDCWKEHGGVPSTTRRSDCPLENCEKLGRCEFPQDCDAPSSTTPQKTGETPLTDSAALWLMAEGPLPAGWKCPRGQEADIRQFNHELLGPCTEWKVVTAAIARRLERGASTPSATPRSQQESDKNWLRAQRDVAEEKVKDFELHLVQQGLLAKEISDYLGAVASLSGGARRLLERAEKALSWPKQNNRADGGKA